MSGKIIYTIFLLFVWILLPAHPISISWATLRTYEKKVDIQINILAEDLFLFQGLEPDEQGFCSKLAIEEAAGRHQEFLSQFFFLEDLEGNRLEGQFIRCQPFEIPAVGIHRDSLMQYSLLYFFEFRSPGPISGLQVFQQFGGSLSPIPAVVMATAYQDGAPGPLTAEVSRERPWLLSFDWKDPSAFGAKRGIPYFEKDDACVAFLQIEDNGLRQEIAIPFKKLESFIPIERAQSAFLKTEEEVQASESIASFFTQNIAVAINGRPTAPASVQVEFDGASEARGQPLANAVVRILLDYPAESPPSMLEVKLELFNWQARSYKAEISVFGKVMNHTFSRYQPAFYWKK